MRRFPFTVFAIAVAAVLGGPVMAGSNDDSATLKQIAGYREWTRMNPEPVKVDGQLNLPLEVGG